MLVPAPGSLYHALYHRTEPIIPDLSHLDPLGAVQALAASLAVGLLVGLERGWQAREVAEGGRVAGFRTFALVGLLGGTLALLSDRTGPTPLAAVFLGLAALLAVSYRQGVDLSHSISLTTAVAALLTLALGALAAIGHAIAAIAAAVVVALLLDLKPVLHRWLQRIESNELTAALQLLVLSVVVLPLLPDSGYGPYAAINPYRLWWAVVLVASLSMTGHVAMRLTGSQHGLLWTGLVGGLASSTAATLALARLGRGRPEAAATLAAATVASCGVMFIRMSVLVAALQPALFPRLGSLLVALALATLAAAYWQWHGRLPEQAGAGSIASDAQSLFDLRSALGFGAGLAAIAVIARAAQDWLGAPGLYGLSALSGLADVDAIVISVLPMSVSGQLAPGSATLAVLVAAASNMVMKAGMAWTIGGRSLGLRVGLSFAAVAVLGATGLAAATA